MGKILINHRLQPYNVHIRVLRSSVYAVRRTSINNESAKRAGHKISQNILHPYIVGIITKLVHILDFIENGWRVRAPAYDRAREIVREGGIIITILRQHVLKSGPDAIAGTKPPFSTFGPLLVLSMVQTRALKTWKLLPHHLSPRLYNREH